MVDTWKTPYGSHGLENPRPLNLRNHALFIQRFPIAAGCGLFYLMCIFTWCQTIMCRIAWYTIGNYPYCRNIHNQIDGGDFSFSSSPRLITLYTSCKQGQNRGVTLFFGLQLTSCNLQCIEQSLLDLNLTWSNAYVSFQTRVSPSARHFYYEHHKTGMKDLLVAS